MMSKFVSRTALAAVLVCTAAACFTPPTHEEIEAADVGPQPVYALARNVAEEWLRARIGEREFDKRTAERMLQVDEPSAEIHWVPALERGWYEIDRSTTFAWQLTAIVNARNAKDEFTGEEPWAFWFRYGSLVAVAEPSVMGKLGAASELSGPILLPTITEHASRAGR